MSKTQWTVKDTLPKGSFFDQQDAVVELVTEHFGGSYVSVRLADGSQETAWGYDEVVELRKALGKALKAWNKVGVV